jgi:hypothetical protein
MFLEVFKTTSNIFICINEHFKKFFQIIIFVLPLQQTCLLLYLVYTITVNYNLVNRFYQEKVDVFPFVLGIINTECENDPEGYDNSDDRETVNLSGKESKPTEQDKESGKSSSGNEVTLTYRVGVKEENACRFQGK